jgi:carbon-monoxide dehydrogenase medium subunit
MKPAPFKYYAPTSVDEALAHLAEHGYDAKVLAGGQSLIPVMNFRLAQPAVIVDLNHIPELFYIRPAPTQGRETANGKGGLRLGAMTRQSQVERDPLVAQSAPLVTETMPHVAYPQIRSRGTFGGSIAHADPSAHLPAVSVALRGRFRLRNQSAERWVPANEFFIALFTTALEPDELLVEIELPPLPPRSGWSFQEVARRKHDFPLAGVAAVVTLAEGDPPSQATCQEARLVFVSLGDAPMEARQAAEMLQRQVPTSDALRAAAETAAQADIDPVSDIHATAEFRRHLAGVLARRALEQAFERAREN